LKRILDVVKHKLADSRYSEKHIPRYLDVIEKSSCIMKQGNTWVFVARVSSRNQEFIYMVPYVIEALGEAIPYRVFKVLVSTDIASEGLNLQEFNIVVNYETPWSPVRREQRIGRVYRLRQERDCVVVDFIRGTTIEFKFYTKLIYKLLDMVEQRLSGRPIEGILELYVAEKKPSGEEYLVVSETTIGLKLAELYKNTLLLEYLGLTSY